ncbi:cytochrome c [Magnetospirillum sp. UT-4]|uniref:c-type cytochrome n=1 Tax=Magnetospirillum sp. UT-4 TaxID=2681467 RepID=UPI001383C0D8|nr:cytochrome c [Magnetospirillum sp. UT-4]CAA7616921.1 exported hypothetical protein [Magnetospirillum sp. UT-4]
MRVLAGVIGVLVLLALALVGWLYTGRYDVSAGEGRTPVLHWLAETAKRQGVRHAAKAVVVPEAGAQTSVEPGALLYQSECMACHGAPGVPPRVFARSMRPAPGDLAVTAREWTSAELYWIVRYGLAGSGMPAWDGRLSEDELWSLVALVNQLPSMDSARWQDLTAPPPPPEPEPEPEMVPPAEAEEPPPAAEPAPAEPAPGGQ